MRRILFLLPVFVLVCGTLQAAGDTPNTPALLEKHLEVSRDFTLKVAGQMPDSDYSFKMTPAQMSFAQQLVHVASANYSFYATLAGEKSPARKPETMSKAAVQEFVRHLSITLKR